MAGQLPSIGVVSYNGYTFPNTFKANVQAAPIYDTANRTVKYVAYVFHIRWPVVDTAATNIDASVETIRRCLMEAGGAFSFTLQGFGTLTTTATDVAFGPTPRSYSWRPIGSNRSAELSWSVEIHVPECCNVTPLYEGVPMEWTYDVTYSIDRAGMTARTVTGTIEIPMTRVGHTIPDIADAYRDRINLPIPENFRRTDQSFNVSRDKRTLSFSITDTEIASDSPYPPGVVDVDCTFTVSRSPIQIFGGMIGVPFANRIPLIGGLLSRIGAGVSISVPSPIWHININASFTMAAQKDPKLAYDAFVAIRDDRLAQAALGRIVVDGGLTGGLLKYLVLLAQSFSEGIYNRHFQVSETWVMPMFFETVLKMMWRRVPAANSQWSTSFHDAFGIRGHAELHSTSADDVIVDLCQSTDVPMAAGEGPPALKIPGDFGPGPGDDPAAKASWLHHDLKFNLHRERSKIRHRHYQPEEPTLIPGDFPGNKSDGVGGHNFYDPNHQVKDTIQTLGASGYTVELQGSALRVGYGIPAPGLVSIGGKQAIEIYDGSTQSIVSHAEKEGQAVPIFSAQWHKVYYLDDAPIGPIGAPNSFFGGGGDTKMATFQSGPWT